MLLGAGLVAGIALAGAAWWWVGSFGSDTPVAWARLGTADVHALTFDASDADRLLFGHHVARDVLVAGAP